MYEMNRENNCMFSLTLVTGTHDRKKRLEVKSKSDQWPPSGGITGVRFIFLEFFFNAHI